MDCRPPRELTKESVHALDGLLEWANSDQSNKNEVLAKLGIDETGRILP